MNVNWYYFIIVLLSLNYYVSPANPSFKPTAATTTTTASLEAFEFDYSGGKISLTFNIEVQAKTLEPTMISLQSTKVSNSNTAKFYIDTIYNDMEVQGNSTTIYFYLISDDFARLQFDYLIGITSSTTYITMQLGAIESVQLTLSDEISSSNAFGVTTYIPDTIAPNLLSYILDMNLRCIVFYFNKPIQLDSFQLNGIQIQSLKNIKYEGVSVRLVNTNMTINDIGDYNRFINVSLGQVNFNLLTSQSGIASNFANTYLSTWASFVRDMSGNEFNYVILDETNGLEPTTIVADTKPPVLLYFNWDITPGCLILYFSEAVKGSYFNESAVVLTNAEVGDPTSIFFRINDASYITVEDTNFINICMNTEQIRQIRNNDNIASTIENTYLIVEYGAVIDNSEAANIYEGADATYEHAMQVLKILPDSVPPTVVSFSLNMTSQVLSVTFSELIDITSITLSAMTIQSKASTDFSTESITLSSDVATILNSENDYIIDIQLQDTIFLANSEISILGTSYDNTYLAISRSFCNDKGGNRVLEISTARALQCNFFYADYIPPYISEWSINLNEGIITLEFSKLVDTASLVLDEILLASDAQSMASTELLKLDTSSYIFVVENTQVQIKLSESTITSIKNSAALCQYISSCYLSTSEVLGFGKTMTTMSGSDIKMPIRAVDYLALTSFETDATAPKLLSFNFNINLGSIQLIFNEPVNMQIFESSGIRLLSKYEDGDEVKLTDECFYDDNKASSVTIYLSYYDFNIIKSTYSICREVESCYLQIRNFTVTDNFGNNVNSSGTFRAENVVKDSTGPTILAFSYQNKRLSIFFSEIIDYASINLASFYVMSSAGSKLDLSKASVITDSYSSNITIDMNPLYTSLLTQGILTTQDSSLLFMAKKDCVYDLFDNGNLKMSSAQPVRAGNRIISFRFDVSLSLITLELAMPLSYLNDYVVKINEFSITDYNSESPYTLTGYKSIYLSYSVFLHIELTEYDKIRILSSFLISKEQLLLIVNQNGITDPITEFGLSEVVSTITCDQLKTDHIPPTLLSFNLDLNTGILDLYFSKTVLVNSISIGQMKLVNCQECASWSNRTEVILNDATIITSDIKATVVSIQLNNVNVYPCDKDRIILSKIVGVDETSVYATFNKGFVKDDANPPNFMDEVDDNNAIKVSSFSKDETPPTLLKWSLNWNSFKLTVYFDESVNATTSIPSFYTLGADPNDPDSTYYDIMYSTVSIDESIGNSVVMNIDSRDFDNIMRLSPNLCHKISNCYLSYKQGVLVDLSGNLADANYYRYGAPAIIIQEDTTSPEIIDYNLNIDEAYMEVFFDEVIDCVSFLPQYFTLQYDFFIGEVSTEKFELPSASSVICAEQQYQKYAMIMLDKSSITKLKSYDVLVKSKSSTYLIINSKSVQDAFGNYIKSILDGYAIPVTNFTKDSIPPNVAAFTVSVQGVMTIIFDEPIDPDNFVVSNIILQDNYPISSASYILTDSISTVQNYDELKLKYRISLSTDFSRIKASGTVLNYQDKTFLRVTSTTTSDTSSNVLNTIPEYEAIQMGPGIIHWSFDNNDGIVYVEFTEEVNSNFSLHGVYLQSCKNYTDACIEYVLSTADNVTSFNGSMSYYYLELNSHDLNSLKYSKVAEDSVFLRVSYGLTSSISESTVIPYLKTVDIREYNALEVYSFTPDTTAPSVTGYIVDLNNGRISIIFDEPINTGSDADITGLTFISSEGGYLKLTASSTISLTNLTYIFINMSASDLNRAKIVVEESLINNLIIEAGCFADYSNNFVPEYSTDSPVLISEYIVDTLPPIVINATLALGSGVLTVILDEVVIDSNLNSTYFSLFNDSRMELMVEFNFTDHTLIESFVSQNTIPYLVLDLFFYDYDYFRLVLNGFVGTSSSDTFLAYRHITDLFGNFIDTVEVTSVDVVADDINPILTAFDLTSDSTPYLLTLHFSEVINITTFTCDDFILRSLNSEAVGVRSIELSDDKCTPITSTSSAIISVTLSSSLFSSGETIGNSQESTWIQTVSKSSNNPSTEDLSGNKLVSIVASNSLRSGPRLKRYLIDMNDGIIRLVFSNNIAVSNETFYDVRNIGFYSDISSSYYFFSNHSQIKPIFNEVGQNDSMVAFYLCDDDLSGLKKIDVGVTGDNLNFIIDGPTTFQDESGNFVDEITKDKKFTPYRLIIDSQRPNLLDVTYDAGMEYLTLLFDEPISTETFVPTNFRIQSRQDSIKNSYKLTGGYITSVLNSVTIQLSVFDAGNIKLQHGLAKNESTSYISCIFKSATDIAGNVLRSIKSSDAFYISHYIFDIIQPELRYFSINFDNGILSLTFTEPVLVSSIDLPSLTLQNRPNSRDGANYTLTGGTIISTDGNVISLQLLDSDIFNIKYKVGLCRSKSSTYITITSNFVIDTSGNDVVPIIDGLALACSAYVGDTSSPYITSISANIDEHYIDFNFNELINIATTDASYITVQSLGSSVTNSFTLTYGVSKVSESYNHIYSLSARIIIGTTDLNAMKYSYPLLTKYHTFISVQSAFIKDSFGNEVLTVNTNSAIEVLPFTPDMSRPILVSYTLDMNLEIIILVFDEAMLGSSISLDQLIMQTNATRRDGNYTTMKDASYEIGRYSKSTTVQFSITDVIIYMKYMNLGLTQQSSLLCWSDTFIADTSNHFILPLWDASVFGNYEPRTPDVYIPDTTAPSLVRWYIDREIYVMHLIFDEPVTLVNVSSITLFKSLLDKSIVTPGYNCIITGHEYDSQGVNVNVRLEDYCITYGVLNDGEVTCLHTFYNTISEQSDIHGPLYISLPQISFQDRAYVPNLINEISGNRLLAESGPDCSLCASGYFVSEECTSHSDRICSKCSTCIDGFWTETTCGEYQDTICAKCSECSYGTYESNPCSENSDKICSLCSECGDDEYVSSECLFGNDVICNSCKVCDISDSTILAKCIQGTYYSWYQENCCVDEAGEKVACNAVDLANIKLGTISGRHHWVFPITSPDIPAGTGYDLSDGGF